MIRFEVDVYTTIAGDIAMAARDVGGQAKVSKCNMDGDCHVTCVIPKDRIEDFASILGERAAM